MIRWGFVGAGSIARSNLAPAVHRTEGATLHAVAAHDGSRASALGAGAVHTDYARVVEDPRVDVVYVCLHNSAHLPWVLRALEAGKHVLCEKPLGLTAGETRLMVETAARHQRLLVEAMWNRWHPRTRDIERFVEQGRIGAVRQVGARFDGALPAGDNYRWDHALGGGALLDLGCYAVGAALGAFSWRLPDNVRATRVIRRPGEADARFSATLGYSEGRADVAVAFTAGQTQDLDIRGTAGRIRARVSAYTAGAEPVDLVLTTSRGTQHLSYPAVDPYQLMVADVTAAAAGHARELVPWEHSLAVATVLDAVREAAVTTAREPGDGGAPPTFRALTHPSKGREA